MRSWSARLERRQLRAQDEPLEHVARLAVEREHTAAETVLVARRRLRTTRNPGSVADMCTEPDNFATGAPSCHLRRARISPVNRGSYRRTCSASATPPDYSFVRQMSRTCNCDKVAPYGGCDRNRSTQGLPARRPQRRRGARRGRRAASTRTDPHADVADADLDDLQRLTLANAIAAQALRGLVESMLKRRGKLAAETVRSGRRTRGVAPWQRRRSATIGDQASSAMRLRCGPSKDPERQRAEQQQRYRCGQRRSASTAMSISDGSASDVASA